jgi:SNF2 family DNA or RNA helicase
MIKVRRHNRKWLKAEIIGSKESFKLSLNLIKDLPVRTWVAKEKQWIFPLRDLPAVAKECKSQSVKIYLEDDTIKDSYAIMLKKGKNLLDLKKRYKESFPEMDVLKLPLRKFQQAGAKFIYHTGNAVLGDMVGLGKTCMSLAVAERRMKEDKINFHIVLCPATLKYNWDEEFVKFTDRTFFIQGGSKAKRKKAYKAAYKYEAMIINYDLLLHDWEMISEFILEKGFRFQLSIDECQYIKNDKAKRTKLAKKLAKKAIYVLGMSATSMENSPLDLWSIFHTIDTSVYGDQRSFSKFMDHYVETDYFGKPTGYTNLNTLRKRKNTTFIRRLKDWVLDELPERIENTYWIKPSSLQMELYNEVKNRIVHNIADMEKAKRIAMADVLPMITYLRMCIQSTELVDHKQSVSTKMDELLDFIHSIDEDSKIVVFCHYVKMIDVAIRELEKIGVSHMYIRGSKTPANQRVATVNAFNDSPETRVLVTTDVLREGVNITSANYVINFDILFNPARMEQRIGRIDRMTNDHKTINIINLVAKGTIEEDVFNIQHAKKIMAIDVLDGGAVESRLTLRNIMSLLDVE